MSVVYDLPERKQKENECWIVAPSVAACTQHTEQERQQHYRSFVASLAQHYTQRASFWQQGQVEQAGLDPDILDEVFPILGFSRLPDEPETSIVGSARENAWRASFSIPNLPFAEQEIMANHLEELLRKFGPLVFIRKSGGGHGLHAVVIIGVVKVIAEHQTEPSIRFVIHNPMPLRGEVIEYQSVKEFLEWFVLTRPSTEQGEFILKPRLWYYQPHKDNTDRIAQVDLPHFSFTEKGITYRCYDGSEAAASQQALSQGRHFSS